MISGALKWAQRKQLVTQNVAKLVDNKPSAPEGNENVRNKCWSAEEAQAFLETSKSFGPQAAVFFALALDSGARKGELCGLRWPHVDLQASKIAIVEQLIKPGKEAVLGPPKQGRSRTIHISPETCRLLKTHLKHQAKLKMKNRKHYRDQRLVFAKENEHLTRGYCSLGDPLDHVGQRWFQKIAKAAGVRRITFHGLRHTCATLLLKAGVPVPVVSERLGHKSTFITMDIYQHVLPDMQEDAATRLGAILFG